MPTIRMVLMTNFRHFHIRSIFHRQMLPFVVKNHEEMLLELQHCRTGINRLASLEWHWHCQSCAIRWRRLGLDANRLPKTAAQTEGMLFGHWKHCARQFCAWLQCDKRFRRATGIEDIHELLGVVGRENCRSEVYNWLGMGTALFPFRVKLLAIKREIL